jgi:hypothetical protein
VSVKIKIVGSSRIKRIGDRRFYVQCNIVCCGSVGLKKVFPKRVGNARVYWTNDC